MPGPPTFRAAFGNIRVFNPTLGEEQRFDVGAARMDGDYLPYFEQLTIRTGLAANAEVQVVLGPPTYKEFIDLIEGPWVRLGNTLSVRWGFTDNPSAVSPWFHSMMLKPEVTIGDSWGLTIVGTGFDFSLKRSSSQKVWASEEAPRSLMDVIKELAAVYGMPVIVNASLPATGDGRDDASSADGTAVNPLPEEVRRGLFDPRTSLVQSGINDWAFLRREVQRIGCWFWIERGYVINVFYGSSPPPPKSKFVMFGPANIREGVYPMWNFATDSGALFLPGRGVALSHFGRNGKRTAKLPPVEEASLGGAQLLGPAVQRSVLRSLANWGQSGLTIVRGADGAPSLPVDLKADPEIGVKAMAARPGSAHEWMPVSSQDETAELAARARSDLNVQNLGLQVEWDSLDDPTLGPGDLVQTENLGKPFSGNHRVIEIEHRIGSSFGEMHIKAGQLGWLADYEHPNLSEPAGSSKEDAAAPGDSEEKSSDPNAGA